MKPFAALVGAIFGGLFTLPLMALLYLADQAGLPLVMYDLFDWLARVLPGNVVINSIETMVEIIDELSLGATDSTAKTLEHLAALAMFLGIGIATGAILFAILDRRGAPLTGAARFVPGLIAGLIVAVPIILISRDINVTAEASGTASAAWIAIALLAWGALLSWAYARWTAAGEPVPVESGAMPAGGEPISRRQFLVRVGGATATITVVGAGLARYLEQRDEQAYQDLIAERRDAVLPAGLPNEGATVEPAPGTRPEYTPLEDHYQIDINARPPEINEDDWRLAITGMVERPLTLTLDEVKANYEPVDQYVTLACISNPVGGDLTSTTRWTGARLSDVLADAGVQDGAAYLRITSQDGFHEMVDLALVEAESRVMLAYHWDGIPLLYKHGFPLRIYIPDRYGMKQPKWITQIEVTDRYTEGYWVERGWDEAARMRTTSVVDVVAGDSTFERDGQVWVPVGGIAHAGARGVSRVEVRVDEGEWSEAALRTPLSDTTWVIWRYDWPFEAGRHTVEVRCIDGDGEPQTTANNGTFPSGATGIHRLTRTV
jgi:DMSO/TMAO reductase YedYZ molybdopterin-dependent catalytic subunit